MKKLLVILLFLFIFISPPVKAEPEMVLIDNKTMCLNSEAYAEWITNFDTGKDLTPVLAGVTQASNMMMFLSPKNKNVVIVNKLPVAVTATEDMYCIVATLKNADQIILEKKYDPS